MMKILCGIVIAFLASVNAELQPVTDDELLNLMKTEPYVVVLFCKYLYFCGRFTFLLLKDQNSKKFFLQTLYSHAHNIGKGQLLYLYQTFW